MNRLDFLEKPLLRQVPDFQVGDTVEVHVRIKEGEKSRIQAFKGTVIARRGEGLRAMFTVRRIVSGEGVERTFPLQSPLLEKIKVTRGGKVRRAKIYYVRDLTERAARLKERRELAGEAEAEAGAAPAAGAPAAPETPGS